MRGPRAAKRRRVSGVDEDGDIEMGDGQDVTVPSPTGQGEEGAIQPNDKGSPTPIKASRRRSRGLKPEEEHSTENGAEETTETPRAGTRSSGRQRKPPARYEDESTGTPTTRKVDTLTRDTPTRTGRTPRSTRKARQVFEVEEDGESPQPPRTLTRTRSKRAAVRFSTTEDDKNDSAGEQEESKQSPSPEYQDGFDDLVSVQLQQDLAQDDGKEAQSTEPLPDYAEQLQTLSQKGLQNELNSLTRIVLEKLNGKRPIPLKGLESEYDKVHHLIEQTVTVGEGNSMLLLGSRGCGKTTIVERVISSLAKEHKNDFHVVRLNGFFHTDDRLALREMWRQLGRETNTEDEAGKVSNYADTMATLLALLSHPEELFGADNPEGMTAAKSVVIVLDEFDLFVSHPRQTLLYNLFDIAQARKAPVAVIGLTTKVDVTEMLEKRVKSRFSHRYVFVPLPRTFDIFSEICFAGLDIDEEEASDLADLMGLKSANWTTLLEGWRTYLKALFNDEPFQTHLQRIYHTTKSVKEFFTTSLIAISSLHTDAQIPTPKSFSQTLTCPDPPPLPFFLTTPVSSSPSSLPLSLLLAATRLTALYDPGDTAATQLSPLALSFPAAYAEYVRLLTSAKTSASVSGASATPGRVWGRDVAREAWEKLVGWGLVNPVGGGSGTADGRMFRVEVSFEEVVEMAGSGGSLGKWWRDG